MPFKRITQTAFNVKWWLLHRTFYRYHIVRCDGLRPGYYDKDEQLLHASFGILCDYVESELAWANDMLKVPRWRYHLLLLKEYRRPASGLAHLDWEISLRIDESCGVHPGEDGYGEPTGQAISAGKIKALYLWWRETRPSRPDHNQGYMDLQDRQDSGEAVSEEQLNAEALKCGQIEQAYEDEDTEMLKMLADVRGNMWT